MSSMRQKSVPEAHESTRIHDESSKKSSLCLPKTNDESKGFKCDVCGKSFSVPRNVIRHKKTIHERKVSKVKKEGNYKCRICEQFFNERVSRRRHETKKHNFTPEFKRKLICSECKESFYSKKDIMNHFPEAHPDLKINIEEKEFKSEDDFNLWKSKVEKQTLSAYVTKENFKVKDALVKKFLCHRSGDFVSASTEKRHYPSNKTGYFCPASIRTQTQEDGKVLVTFIPTHIGHNFDVDNLRQTKLFNKKNFADKVHAEVPEVNVDENASLEKQLATTKLQELRKAAVSYSVNMDYFRSIDGALTVDSWVENMKSKGCSPIIIYKFPDNVLDERSDVDVDDFILGFMNQTEEDIFILKKGVINQYSTHTNKNI